MQLERAGRRPLELAVADYYRRQGYSVTQLPIERHEPDFEGIDLLLRQGSDFLVVACRDRLQPMFHHELQALQRRLPGSGAGVLIVATPDAFDVHCREIADRSPQLQLVDGRLLRVLLGDARMDALMRELADARAAYPLPAVVDEADTDDAQKRPLGPTTASLLVLAMMAVLAATLGWWSMQHRGDAAPGPGETPTGNDAPQP